MKLYCDENSGDRCLGTKSLLKLYTNVVNIYML